MERTTVYSSVIVSIGYLASSRTLDIEFKRGTIYQYSNVPEYIFDGLMDSSSKGDYFDNNIKKAGYGYRQVR
jgi:hypothetical protein